MQCKYFRLEIKALKAQVKWTEEQQQSSAVAKDGTVTEATASAIQDIIAQHMQVGSILLYLLLSLQR